MRDLVFEKLSFRPSVIDHDYGKNIHILADPYMLLGLSRLCSSECKQPEIHYWIKRFYSFLIHNAVNVTLEKADHFTSTRMKVFHPEEAKLEMRVPNPNSKIVVVDIARAGTLPSFVCYDELNYFFNPDGVRQDHLVMARELNAEGHVIGSSINGSKIGGDVEGAYVFIPDPMGATGSTVVKAIEAYRDKGKAKKWVAMHLIVTPEYLKAVQKAAPHVEVFALRLDRGLSSREVLKTKPGSRWDEERGLNDKQYIVPGGGGLGEILNNTLS